tara:strand:- start:606 stop:1592 length:987 start_codon:yes stop_codon:yes gene_type:complete
MILKSYEINKINIDDHKIILLYGKNEGHKNESIRVITNNKVKSINYDEKEILENTTNFLESIFTVSLFENEKIIIIKRATDKILKIIEEISIKKINDTKIIINADNLEKKSKLRNFFEKNKNCICVPFFPDNEQTLMKLAYTFFRKKKIAISQSEINQIVNKCNGDRLNLNTELEKIEFYVKGGKKLNSENLSKLVNLNENYSVSELINNCLAKNKKQIIKILNENNYTNEDSILIIRTLLNQSKKIIGLLKEYEKNQNIDLTISTAKPPIFWKDKEITKKQIFGWKSENLKKLIYELNDIELLIKNNINNSVNLITDFILSKSVSQD